MSRPKKTIEQRNATRERILAAASELLEKYGSEEISIRAITAGLGISPMGFYSYFTSRAELIDALREQQLRAFDEGASQFLARARQEGAAPVLRETLQLLVDTACGQPQRFLLLYSAAGEPDALVAPPWRLDGIIQFFGQLIEIGMQRGEFAPRDPHMAALTMFSLYTGALLLRVSGRLPDSGQFDALLRETEGLALRYLSTY
ncbi:MAG: TetR/AcrR family transcriptional regulator [Chloroflexi bacterium]|nr:TetR/AcrR family transcriptional regulator [Chloroflexota bacterium]